MAAVHILIFGEMEGFKIVPFIAMHAKMNFFFHGAMKKNFQPIRTRQFARKKLILNYQAKTNIILNTTGRELTLNSAGTKLTCFCGQCRSKIRVHRTCSLIFDLYCLLSCLFYD